MPRIIRVVLGLLGIPLLGVAVGLAALRLTQPQADVLRQTVAFTAWGLPAVALAAPALLVALRGRTRFMAVGTAMLVLAVHVAWLAPYYSGDAPIADRSCSLRVLTINAQTADPLHLAPTARAHRPDVLVVLQADQTRLSALRRALPELPSVTELGPEGFADAVVFSRFELRGVTTHLVPVRWMRVENPCLPDLQLVAAHPASPVSPRTWDRTSTLLRDLITSRAGDALTGGTGRLVVAGDLNATADQRQLQQTLALGLRDAAEVANAGYQLTYPAPGTTRRRGVPLPPLVGIDHVLVGPRLAVTEVRTVTFPGADHLGVLAVIHPERGG